MAGTMNLFHNGKGSLVGPRLHPLQVPQRSEHASQVAHVNGHLGMIGSVDRLVNGQGPLIVRPGPR